MTGDDLSPFFVPGEFAGDEDTLNGAPITGIYDGAFLVTGDGMGMADTRPVYLVPASAVPEDVEGMTLVANKGVRFKVVGVEPDGTGLAILVLEFA